MTSWIIEMVNFRLTKSDVCTPGSLWPQVLSVVWKGGLCGDDVWVMVEQRVLNDHRSPFPIFRLFSSCSLTHFKVWIIFHRAEFRFLSTIRHQQLCVMQLNLLQFYMIKPYDKREFLMILVCLELMLADEHFIGDLYKICAYT